MQETHGGLRDRQRAETLLRLHDAAIDLVQEHGLTETTVSEIADRAGVSRRTFFNYFASKEDAVLGAGEPTIPADAVDHLLDGPEQFDRAVRIVFSVASSGRHVRNRPAERRALIMAHPELKARTQHHAMIAHDLLAKALAERYDGADADRALALLLLATAVLRFAYSRDPDVLDTPDSPAVGTAINVFRTTIKDLS
ncbi:TetR/AcrR family transcriptional regulator [Gordonia liuliyuniae]|uniref:TetR/AcrR family transcriptional regulator n=1 Tax=Gordonia liuliyuniae TaxID=2911517 RepID=A0ABS9IV01_9ACTN|nr:TetR/AcrR family transcriptional regulator [Gordonia liuliyuniae]MCF8589395.1 TetR/AcrR family transcriptional regulator [Gordonia liuliyuniae]